MLLSRDELITTLFRETDRAQRFKTALALILCGIDGWKSWIAKVSEDTARAADVEISERIAGVFRCCDLLGRYGDGEFALILPGCNSFSAVGMAGRLRQEVFGSTFCNRSEALTFEASFGIAGSGGRSPLVVLRNAENALNDAKMRRPGPIVRSSYAAETDPATFLRPVMEDEVLRW